MSFILGERDLQEVTVYSEEPHWAGDGYFESVVSDPGGNLIEITI